MIKAAVRFIAVTFAAVVLTGANSWADDFYKDKSIRLIVGTDAGGGYDFSARLVARHIARSIAGSPQIIVQNMPGADSLVAGNYIYNSAPQDGTIVGALVQTLPQLQLFGGNNVKFDAAKFQWLGTPSSSVSVVAVWHTTPVKTFADTMTTPVVLGSSGQVGLDYNIPMMLNSVLGTKFKVISGYKGGNQVDLAIERGEIQGRGGGAWAGWKVTRPEWVKDKKLKILVQTGIKPAEDLPGVPMITDFAKTDEQKVILNLFASTVSIGRPLVFGPGVASDHVAVLRTAFAKTMKDPEFLADAEKTRYDVSPILGEDLQGIVAKLMATPAQVAAKAREAVSAR